jgi:hypothetical protein
VWVKRDGDDVLVSTVAGRRKHRSLVADPRATVLVYALDDPYSYVEVRGSVTLTEVGGRGLIDELCEKYRGITPFLGDRARRGPRRRAAHAGEGRPLLTSATGAAGQGPVGPGPIAWRV